MDKQDFEKSLSDLRPDIERLVRKVDENPSSAIVGFIFSTMPQGLIKFGNVENVGENLIQLHTTLASLAAEMIERPKSFPFVAFADVSDGGKIVGQAPEEIADALAKAVLVTGMEESHVARVQEMAQRSLLARRPQDAH